VETGYQVCPKRDGEGGGGGGGAAQRRSRAGGAQSGSSEHPHLYSKAEKSGGGCSPTTHDMPTEEDTCQKPRRGVAGDLQSVW